ncbi:PQQ-dependent sugar dehydrogenase [Halomontanus rarus]|uniref:PQQ-dependent sugar dehydrogenase n=1 Tax=Halomontanus rarus TaxID=3034020 RepID=UPI001A98F66E
MSPRRRSRPTHTRRAVVTGLATGALALTGCLGDDDPDSPPATDPEDITPVESEYDLSVDHDDLESWERYDPDWTSPTASPLEADLETEVVIENLEIPWDLSFAPDGDLFLSERTGTILRYDSASLSDVARADVLDRADAVEPGSADGGWWAAGSEGGLLGIAVHPNYPDVPLVYAFYTYETDGEYYNRLVYYDVSADDPSETETAVIDGIEGNEIAHNGSRLAFGPENYLWVTTGDALYNDWEEDEDPISQDVRSLAGKVLRIEPDGSPAPGNPDLESEDGAGDPRIYSYGHRNPQGISWLPDGTPIITEHGPGARDEVMVLEPGDNHGWSTARDADTYPGTDFARPVVNIGPGASLAPSGCVFYTGDAVPEWRNRLLVGTLAGQRITAVTVYPADAEDDERPTADGGTRYDADWMHEEYHAVTHHAFEDELGRVRHVEQGPDGALYAITSNRDGRAGDGFPTDRDDVLVRITPAE